MSQYSSSQKKVGHPNSSTSDWSMGSPTGVQGIGRPDPPQLLDDPRSAVYHLADGSNSKPCYAALAFCRSNLNLPGVLIAQMVVPIQLTSSCFSREMLFQSAWRVYFSTRTYHVCVLKSELVILGLLVFTDSSVRKFHHVQYKGTFTNP